MQSYRVKFSEMLKIDFPRIPFTAERDLFKQVVDGGQQLIDLHLLKSSRLDVPICKFEGAGDNRVSKNKKEFRYDEESGRLWINAAQYFGPLPKAVYEYRIGGYQVADKWLKDRKERVLSLADVQHYLKTVTALYHTIQIQAQLDPLFEKVEATAVVFSS